eukprot:5677281-Amphidinium_carterae.1
MHNIAHDSSFCAPLGWLGSERGAGKSGVLLSSPEIMNKLPIKVAKPIGKALGEPSNEWQEIRSTAYNLQS